MWNEYQFIVLQTVTLKCYSYVNESHEIQRWIGKCLDTLDAGHNHMMPKETARMCKKFLYKARRDDLEEHLTKTFHSLVL